VNKKFQQEVLRLRPDLRVANGYFYKCPVDQFLCGFLCEGGSGGFYIWRYALPLYDRLERPHLTFGERLPASNGYLTAAQFSNPKDRATEFVRRIEPYENATYAWRDLGVFLSRIEAMNALENPWVSRAYALTLVMLGRASEAEALLHGHALDPATAALPRFREDIADVRAYFPAAFLKSKDC